MPRLILTATAASLGLAIAACGDRDEGNVIVNADTTADAPATPAPTVAWPTGSRIVVEEGVTYRIDPDDVRVRLGPDDSRIVVENDIRYRVDPDGTRVRIDEQGAVIDLDDVGVSIDTD